MPPVDCQQIRAWPCTRFQDTLVAGTGDMHFYMRHSFCPAPPARPAASSTASSTADSRPSMLDTLARPAEKAARAGSGRLRRVNSAGVPASVAQAASSEAVHDSAASVDGGELSRASSGERHSVVGPLPGGSSTADSQCGLSPSPSVLSLDEDMFLDGLADRGARPLSWSRRPSSCHHGVGRPSCSLLMK